MTNNPIGQVGVWVHSAVTLVALAGLLLVSTGCGNSASVSGKVTYNGQPVKVGSITFLPADGQGPSAGGVITDGAYQIEGMTPGEKNVEIKSAPDVPVIRTSQESADMAAAGVQPAPAKQSFPPEAQGTKQTVTIQSGEQTQDFTLTGPEVN